MEDNKAPKLKHNFWRKITKLQSIFQKNEGVPWINEIWVQMGPLEIYSSLEEMDSLEILWTMVWSFYSRGIMALLVPSWVND